MSKRFKVCAESAMARVENPIRPFWVIPATFADIRRVRPCPHLRLPSHPKKDLGGPLRVEWEVHPSVSQKVPFGLDDSLAVGIQVAFPNKLSRRHVA